MGADCGGGSAGRCGPAICVTGALRGPEQRGPALAVLAAGSAAPAVRLLGSGSAARRAARRSAKPGDSSAVASARRMSPM